MMTTGYQFFVVSVPSVVKKELHFAILLLLVLGSSTFSVE
jgi:hypothetical protein